MFAYKTGEYLNFKTFVCQLWMSHSDYLVSIFKFLRLRIRIEFSQNSCKLLYPILEIKVGV